MNRKNLRSIKDEVNVVVSHKNEILCFFDMWLYFSCHVTIKIYHHDSTFYTMSKTNIWMFCEKQLKTKLWCTKSNLVLARASLVCCTKKYFMSTKARWCCKKYFVLKEVINFFSERCTVCYNSTSLFFWCDSTFCVKCWNNALHLSKGNVQETVNTDSLNK